MMYTLSGCCSVNLTLRNICRWGKREEASPRDARPKYHRRQLRLIVVYGVATKLGRATAAHFVRYTSCSAGASQHRLGRSNCKFARWMANSAVRRANYGEHRQWWLFESSWRYHYSGYPARMAELADAMDSKSIVRKGVWVQVPLRARL